MSTLLKSNTAKNVYSNSRTANITWQHHYNQGVCRVRDYLNGSIANSRNIGSRVGTVS